MKIAIIGSTGYITNKLVPFLKLNYDIVRIGRSDFDDYYLDLVKPDDFDFTILENIDVIIFSAAISSPEKCEIEYNNCYQINVLGTCKFIDQAIRSNCKIIFLSSDAVYEDDGDLVFNEDSVVRPKSAYGKMKLIVEKRYNRNFLFKTLRLSYVISKEDRFTKYCMECIDKCRVAEVYPYMKRNCISIYEVLEVIDWLINNWYSFKYSVLCVNGLDCVSRVEMANVLKEIFPGKFSYVVTYPKKDFFTYRNKNTNMMSKFLYDLEILKPIGFKDNYYKLLK